MRKELVFYAVLFFVLLFAVNVFAVSIIHAKLPDDLKYVKKDHCSPVLKSLTVNGNDIDEKGFSWGDHVEVTFKVPHDCVVREFVVELWKKDPYSTLDNGSFLKKNDAKRQENRVQFTSGNRCHEQPQDDVGSRVQCETWSAYSTRYPKELESYSEDKYGDNPSKYFTYKFDFKQGTKVQYNGYDKQTAGTVLAGVDTAYFMIEVHACHNDDGVICNPAMPANKLPASWKWLDLVKETKLKTSTSPSSTPSPSPSPTTPECDNSNLSLLQALSCLDEKIVKRAFYVPPSTK